MAKKKKFRAEFRKNRTPRARKTDWTRQFDEHGFQEQAPETEERISGRGEINRHRTIRTAEATPELGNAETPYDFLLDVDETCCRRGRVLSVFGAGEHGAGRRRHRLPVCHATDPEDALDRRAQPGGRGRPRSLPLRQKEARRGSNGHGRRSDRAGAFARRKPAAQRGPDRARRSAAWDALEGGSRTPPGHRFQRRSVADRGQRGRTAPEAEPHRSPARGRRKRTRAADRLHQQDRSHRSGELGTAGRCLLSHGLSGVVGQRTRPVLERIASAAWPPDGRVWWQGRAAWASRRC